VTLYSEHEDREQMFSTPRYVIKAGRVIVEDGEPREAPAGELLRVAVDHDEAIERTLRPLFDEHYSVQLANYPVREPWLLEPARRIPAGGGR
jgi:formylmethanofuran dehydrogenase subunit A